MIRYYTVFGTQFTRIFRPIEVYANRESWFMAKKASAALMRCVFLSYHVIVCCGVIFITEKPSEELDGMQKRKFSTCAKSIVGMELTLPTQWPRIEQLNHKIWIPLKLRVTKSENKLIIKSTLSHKNLEIPSVPHSPVAQSPKHPKLPQNSSIIGHDPAVKWWNKSNPQSRSQSKHSSPGRTHLRNQKNASIRR